MAAPTSGLQAEITLKVDGETLGPFALPRRGDAEIGRSLGSAIRLKPAWAPRLLATLTPSERGWMLTNGTRTRVRVKSRWVDGYCQPNALMVLQQGVWDFKWDLDGECRAEVKVERARPGLVQGPPVALSRKGEFVGRALGQRTDVAGSRMRLSPQIRHRLAVLFAYEIEDVAAPVNICKAAAERLGGGVTERRVLNSALRVRARINDLRHESIESLEELGFYIVHVAEAIGPEDLDP